ncbi:hypothetical protein [Actinoplanes sp. NPDC023714]|uniref:hypothetical protein n=1 Tax=Actinoplanes sp. NPDC023714 TaxID=3154322 RepID=UPI00340D0047
MSVIDRGTSTLSRCDSAAEVTDSQFSTLLAQRYRAGPPLRAVHCELASGHEGGHIAFVLAAEQGDEWWWLRWGGGRHEILPLDVCLSQSDHDDCLLPNRHAGEHSFRLATPG